MGMDVEAAKPLVPVCPAVPAPAKEAAGQRPTAGTGAGADVVHARPAPPEAPPPPLPASSEPSVSAKDLFHFDISLGLAAGTRPVNIDQGPTPANDKAGVVASEAVNVGFTHKTADDDIVNIVTVAGGLRARQATLPLASAIAYTGSVKAGHDFGPLLQVGVAGTLYGSNPLDVRDGDPKDVPAGYRYGQIDVTADSKDKLADGGSIVAGVKAGYRFGPGYTNRFNVAAQGTVTEQAGPVQFAVTGGVTGGKWTDRPPEGQLPRMDVSGNLEVKASTPVGDNVRVFATAGIDGRISSQDDGHGSKNYANFGVGVGIQFSADGSSKPKPKN